MAYKLVDKDGAEVTLPGKFKDFRGDTETIIGGQAPRHSGSTGRVYTSRGGEFYPSVFDLKYVSN